MRICFLVGSLAISGGTYVILEHASFLMSKGYDVTLAVQDPFTSQTTAWHDKGDRLRKIAFEDGKSEQFDLVIATWWKTALELGQFKATRYAYFVQSIESRFYPAAELPLRALVDSTYDYPINVVTEATWIQKHIAEHNGQQAALVRNGIRKDVYRSEGPTIAPRDPVQPRVLIEGHFGVSFKNTALGLKLARSAGSKANWVLTGSPVKTIPGAQRVFSRVPMLHAPQIYRSCDILVKLSTVEGMFGPPLEMFHCGGTAVVFDVSGHDEYIVDGRNALVVRTGDTDGVVSAVRRMLEDPSLLARLKKNALEDADRWPSWEEASRQFSEWVETMLDSGLTCSADELRVRADRAWQVYGTDERARLAANPGITRRNKVIGALGRLPKRQQDMIKTVQAIYEVVSPSRRVR